MLRNIHLDHTARNLCAGIAGWLCGKVIPILVDDEGTTDNIGNCETCVVERHPCVSVVGQEGREVSAVERV